LAFDFEPPQPEGQVNFQLSQRADHIVNDIYQWVQFNRAIINARDEPLADYRKYRRLHLLIGDSCVLSLLEEGRLPRNLVLADAVQSTRDISRDTSERWMVRLENGKTVSALDVQWEFHHLAQKHLGHSSAETNWLLENWGYVLEAIPHNRQALIGGVDWITKKWLLETFVQAEGLSWEDPWLQSIDLEYHNIDPRRGLFFSITPGKRISDWNNGVRRPSAMHVPPANTRASGRARAVTFFQNCNSPYVINWDSIACDSRDFLVMGNPFETYNDEVDHFLSKPRTINSATEQQL
jgi:proteasome accessory factor A